MKKLIIAFTLLFTLTSITAQDASVENSFYGIQTGLLGIWIHNETKLANEFALRTEIGLDSEIFINNNDFDFFLTPVLTLEPRWYYNLNKRQDKSKKIKYNSGNFLSLDVSYNPDLFVISGIRNAFVENQVSIIPKWGIRRSIGRFNYEVGIGIGYRYVFEGFNKGSDIAADLHLRIGYQL